MDLTGRLSNLRAPLRRLADLDLGADRCPIDQPDPTGTGARRVVQRRLRPQEVVELAAAYGPGATTRELAARFGIHRNTVATHLERVGVQTRAGRRLSPGELDLAARLYEEGWSATRLAKKLGVSDHTIRAALRKAGVRIRCGLKPRLVGRRSPESSSAERTSGHLPSSTPPAHSHDRRDSTTHPRQRRAISPVLHSPSLRSGPAVLCVPDPALGGRAGDHVAVSGRAPGEGRYARVEREQRWLLRQLPAGLQRPALVVDLYITGTRLRLRRVESDDGVVFKLGQKVRMDPSDPEVVRITTMYLSEDEFSGLAALPGAKVRKTRSHLAHAGRIVAVDRFHGRLEGLVLAEVELDESEERLPLPTFAARDVTNDDRFSGASLASTTGAAVDVLLREVRATTHG